MEYGVCLEMFFRDRPFVERIRAAAEAGFRHAEMWFMDLTAVQGGLNPEDKKEARQLRAVAEKAGVCLTNAVIGAPDGSIGGGLTDPAQRRKWLQRAEQTLSFCKAGGIKAAIVCTGNVVPGLSAAKMRESVKTGLEQTVSLAEKHGIELWLEPLNDKIDHRNYFLTSSDAAAELCRQLSSPQLKVLFDCYHMQIMEGDLSGHIRRNIDVIGHFHAAGHPGRHELWLGETNYPGLLKEIEKLDFQGIFSLEYLPTLEPSESLKRAQRYLRGE